MTEKFGYDKITLDVDGIRLDGHLLDAFKIGRDITVDHGSDNIDGPKVTISLYADEITVTDEAKQIAKDTGSPIVELHGEMAATICTRKMTEATCTHTYRYGTPANEACDGME